MKLSEKQKLSIKKRIKNLFSKEKEIQKIIIFGSFVQSETPNDIDIAIFQNSDREYLSLSLKYRKLIRELINELPFDVIPLKMDSSGSFLERINSGEIIFER